MIVLALTALAAACPQKAAPAPSAPDLAQALGEVHEVVLDNGWTFLLVPRPGAPVTAFETRVATGSADEVSGRTGIATLVARCMTKGSDRIGTADWNSERVHRMDIEERRLGMRAARAEQQAGGALAGATEAFEIARSSAARFARPHEFERWLEDAGSEDSLGFEVGRDATRFFVSLPSNQLELWCWLEAERFTRPVLRDFYRERELALAALTERQADPALQLLDELSLAAYRTHPYRHPPAGYAADVRSIMRSDAEQFFRDHYAARDVVTAIVGGFDPDALTQQLERYFADVPSGQLPEPESVVPREEAPQGGERRVQLVVPGAAPLSAHAWHGPGLGHPDRAAFQVTLRVLAGGSWTHLAQRVVRDEGLALSLRALDTWSGECERSLGVIVFEPFDAAGLERVVTEELARLAHPGPAASEVASAARTLALELRADARDPARCAELVTRFAQATGDWRGLLEHESALLAVRPEDVRRMVRAWFFEGGRTIVDLHPPRPAQAPGDADATLAGARR